MAPEEVDRTIRQGAALGCTEALFTFGERPEEEPGFPALIRKTGFASILDYCEEMCRKSIAYGVLPHTNAGILTYGELERLRAVNASMGLMLETTAEIPAHATSKGKDTGNQACDDRGCGKTKNPVHHGNSPRDRRDHGRQGRIVCRYPGSSPEIRPYPRNYHPEPLPQTRDSHGTGRRTGHR